MQFPEVAQHYLAAFQAPPFLHLFLQSLLDLTVARSQFDLNQETPIQLLSSLKQSLG